MLVDRLEQDARSRWVVSAVMASVGGRIDEVPPGLAREQLEAALDEPMAGGRPEGLTEEDWALRVALGVA